MTFRPSGPTRPPAARAPIRLPRWPRTVVTVLLALVTFAIVIAVAAGVWTDFLWFRSAGYPGVFATTYGTRWAMFFVAGAVMAALTGASAVLACRLRPACRPGPVHRSALESGRVAIGPHRRLLLAGLLAAVGVVSGIAVSGAWRTWLLFASQVPFGVKDAQFHRDISFFIFTYPFIRLVLGYLFAAVLPGSTAGCAGRACGRAPVQRPRLTCSSWWESSSCSRRSPTGSTGTGSISPSAGR